MILSILLVFDITFGVGMRSDYNLLCDFWQSVRDTDMAGTAIAQRRLTHDRQP